MLAKLFLIANGVLYLGLALWCTLKPTSTSAAIGYQLPDNSARSEYLVVYGGLEVALGAFFLLCAFRRDMLETGLIFAAITYSCLMLYRWGTIILLKDLSTFIYAMVSVETVMTLCALLLLWLAGNETAAATGA